MSEDPFLLRLSETKQWFLFEQRKCWTDALQPRRFWSPEVTPFTRAMPHELQTRVTAPCIPACINEYATRRLKNRKHKQKKKNQGKTHYCKIWTLLIPTSPSEKVFTFHPTVLSLKARSGFRTWKPLTTRSLCWYKIPLTSPLPVPH